MSSPGLGERVLHLATEPGFGLSWCVLEAHMAQRIQQLHREWRGGTGSMSRARQDTEIVRLPVLSAGQRIQYGMLVCLFTLPACYFWTWWLAPAHRGTPVLYWLM